MPENGKQEVFEAAIKGRKIPVLTLDSKWYKLLGQEGREQVREEEEKLNNLLRRQGKLNSDMKNIRLLKKKLMNEMLSLAETASEGDQGAQDRLQEQKRLVEDCNEKLAGYEDELLDIPVAIDEINRDLMLLTMEYCYVLLQENSREIQESEEWVTKMRIELKKRLIRKQEKEQKNHQIYTYLQDLFGPEVADLFDLTYDPEEKHPKLPQEQN